MSQPERVSVGFRWRTAGQKPWAIAFLILAFVVPALAGFALAIIPPKAPNGGTSNINTNLQDALPIG